MLVRGFARYQALFDSRTEVPPSRLLGPAHRRTTPHIYSDDEIAKLIAEAEQLAPTDGLRPRTYATLLGLLACTGLRIMEALRLAREDVNLEASLVTIRETKFHKSRLAPLHPSATLALRSYARLRDQRYPETASPAFFLSERGGALNYSTVRLTFPKLCRCLDWRPAAGSRFPRRYGRPPRRFQASPAIAFPPIRFAPPHAMHLLQSGVDLTVVAMWLGHENPATTHAYVEADLAMKEKALSKTQEVKTRGTRYKPSDKLLRFLEGL